MKKITLEEFQKAQQTIIDFQSQDFVEANGSDRPCICCDKKIKAIHPETIRFPQSGMYSGGIVDRISAGYGSNKDGNMYIVAICDDCTDKLAQENKIEFAGNYMHLY